MKLIKIPFDKGGLGHGDGSSAAPDAIVEQLEELFSNEAGETPTFNIVDVPIGNMEESHENITNAIPKDNAIILGGDHSITYSCVKGFAKHHNEFKLVIFDAHPDLMEPFSPPTQEEFLRALIEENIVKPENIILIGVRNWDEQEITYLQEKNIKNYSMKEMFDRGIKEIIAEILPTFTLPTYLSLDIDVVDPVEAIGTGYIEHGGMSSRELIYAIQQLKSTITVADIVEVNPEKDVNNITAKLAAKLVIELF